MWKALRIERGNNILIVLAPERWPQLILVYTGFAESSLGFFQDSVWETRMNFLANQCIYRASQVALVVKKKKKKKTRLPMQEMQETQVRSLGQEDPLE